MSLFSAVELAPRDPILGLNEQFAADPNPAKVNLGVGVYFDDEGKLPVLKCVAAAERQLLESPKAKGYLPIDGIAAYDKAVQGLVFGAEHPAVRLLRQVPRVDLKLPGRRPATAARSSPAARAHPRAASARSLPAAAPPVHRAGGSRARW